MTFLRPGLLACLIGIGAPLAAKPIITNSEETYARICLAGEDSADRLVAACSAALEAPGLTTLQRAELLAGLGDAYLWQEEFEAAIDVFGQALSLEPQLVSALNGTGWSLRSLDREAEALDMFERSLAVDISVQALGGKASLARGLGMISPDESRAMLGAALTIDPDYRWAVREIGWSYFEEDRHQEAIAEFDRAIGMHAEDTNAHYGRARAALALGDPQMALDALTVVTDLDSGDFWARVYRVQALRDLDRNAQAVRDADRLIEDYPHHAAGYIEKGRALVALERRSDAIDLYRAAETALGPSNALLYWYADALIYDGRLNDAMSVIDRGITLDGADYSDYLLKSYIALEMRDYATARAAAESSLATGVEDPWAHYYIAITMVHEGATDAGLKRFDTAMRTGLPRHRVGAFAGELISAGKFVEAAQLRLKY